MSKSLLSVKSENFPPPDGGWQSCTLRRFFPPSWDRGHPYPRASCPELFHSVSPEKPTLYHLSASHSWKVTTRAQHGHYECKKFVAILAWISGYRCHNPELENPVLPQKSGQEACLLPLMSPPPPLPRPTSERDKRLPPKDFGIDVLPCFPNAALENEHHIVSQGRKLATTIKRYGRHIREGKSSMVRKWELQNNALWYKGPVRRHHAV